MPKLSIILELLKALLLIFFFHFGLYYVSSTYNIPVYPKTEVGFVLTYTLTGFIVVSWLLGERKRFFLIISYFVTFQILGLAVITKNWEVVPRLLTPIFLTYLSLFLFKSPTEFRLELLKQKRKQLVKELEFSKRKIREYEQLLTDLKSQYQTVLEEKRKLEELIKENSLEELKQLLKDKEQTIAQYEKKIAELTNALNRLKENNSQLWDLLEELSTEGSREEKLKVKLKELRRELKNLRNSFENLKNNLKECKDYNELLEKELENRDSTIKRLESALHNFKDENQTLKSEIDRLQNLLKENFLDYLNLFFEHIKLSPFALKDLEQFPKKELTNLFKFLSKLDRNVDQKRLEKLEVPKEDVYRVRFSGGRVYLKREGQNFTVVGILKGEDEKTKDRFIRSRFT